VLQPACGHEILHHEGLGAILERFHAVEKKIVSFNFCIFQPTMICNLELVQSWNPLHVTTHNVWTCRMNKVLYSGAILYCLV